MEPFDPNAAYSFEERKAWTKIARELLSCAEKTTSNEGKAYYVTSGILAEQTDLPRSTISRVLSEAHDERLIYREKVDNEKPGPNPWGYVAVRTGRLKAFIQAQHPSRDEILDHFGISEPEPPEEAPEFDSTDPPAYDPPANQLLHEAGFPEIGDPEDAIEYPRGSDQ